MNQKRLLSYVVIILSNIWLLFGCSNGLLFYNDKVVDGYIDLSLCNFEQEIVRLDGNWEFFWGKFLDPGYLKVTENKKVNYIAVPGTWNKYVLDGKNINGDGYAAYRLTFNAVGRERLALKLPRIYTAYKLYVNGNLVADGGKIGVSKKTMTPQYLPQLAFFDSQPGNNEIIINVSNFYHRNGGITESIMLGSEKNIIKMQYRNVAFELILIGGMLIMSLHHIVIYTLRRQNISSLYFGIFCFLIGLRTTLVGERTFNLVFSNYSWELAQKLEILSFYAGVPVILMFFSKILPRVFNNRVIRLINSIAAFFVIFVLLNPARIYTEVIPIYQIFTIFIIVYILISFIRSYKEKEEGIGLIMAGGLTLMVTSINDLIYLSQWFNDRGRSDILRNIFRRGNLSSIGQLIFVFLISIVLAKRFSASLEQRELSYKDALTGLWNRRHYDMIIQNEWNRNLRYKRSISLMMIDIDYFKQYNDLYGHKAGDECLIRIAQVMQEYFRRSTDQVIRYGGEEFVVIMPEQTQDEVILIAENLRKQIEDLNIDHDGSGICKYVTVSIGVAYTVPSQEKSHEALFLAADKAMYQAKNAGRNRVVFTKI